MDQVFDYSQRVTDLEVILNRPTYTIADAARWAKTHPQNARRWIAGYAHHGDRWSPAVTTWTGSEAFLSFEDLVEVAVVAAIRRAGISMPKIRLATDYATAELRVDRPLVALKFKSDGRDLFISDLAVRHGYTNMTRFGQIAMPIIEAVLRDVDYEAELATRWWPVGRNGRIVVDPRVNFGRPILAGVGVRTETILDRWTGGDTIPELAEEFAAPPDLIEQALRFENPAHVIAA